MVGGAGAEKSVDLCLSAASSTSHIKYKTMRSVNELNESGAFIQKFQCNYNPAA